jgi:hypothetical protein
MRLHRFAFLCVTAMASTAARACTVCNSANGHQLRASLFDGHFLHTMLLVAAPVPVLIIAVLLLRLALPGASPSAALSDASSDPLQAWYADTLESALIAPEPVA